MVLVLVGEWVAVVGRERRGVNETRIITHASPCNHSRRKRLSQQHAVRTCVVVRVIVPCVLDGRRCIYAL